ncbi:hypothetical protein PHYSODRAFT_337638 [Phytophthora sojae]|uniref:Uncharacterized protein n=1 Tax=Phytophthora sojae (strain P6497) TaxID=1094619 RepID=G5A1R8_PHYSP|nr:hypothetical protein PHYSODRAFT_337638 [Phytophthora sojae]EGZ10866.1 hypothetical protein PHYSODRAFT_337638 [Phytophthora sojae]|eukprot:XP_009533611.1 hypothetical protein PHYSODRAFT_337638 [Phytophthora sojae]
MITHADFPVELGPASRPSIRVAFHQPRRGPSLASRRLLPPAPGASTSSAGYYTTQSTKEVNPLSRDRALVLLVVLSRRAGRAERYLRMEPSTGRPRQLGRRRDTRRASCRSHWQVGLIPHDVCLNGACGATTAVDQARSRCLRARVLVAHLGCEDLIPLARRPQRSSWREDGHGSSNKSMVWGSDASM